MKEILLYKSDNAEVKVEILLQNENLWLTQAKMAELFDVQKAAISKHLKNIFADGELDEKVVVSKMETTTPHGAMVGKEQTKFVNIYARCSADYSPDSQITQDFFATVQNKMHYAVTHQTAAEIIYSRADSKKVNMGLTTWKNAPNGDIRKPDVSIAKNYLSQEEIDTLNRIVTMYLDFAELQAKRGQVMYMKDWVEKLNAFLQFNERDILEDKGKVTHEIAKAFAEGEYDKFRIIRDANYKSDFDKLMESIAEYKT